MSEQEEVKSLEQAIKIIREMEEKYKRDPNWKRMPHHGFFEDVKAKLDEKYGVNYIKKRLEVEEKLGITQEKKNDD